MSKHADNCSAPICVENIEDQQDVVWIAGEPVCRKQPYTDLQNKQKRINDLVTKKKSKLVDKSWTLEELLKSNL